MKTYKLSDYELISGDWVKFVNDGWTEFDKYNEFNQPTFHFSNYISNHEVLAVLRPSLIIRNNLDDRLDAIRIFEKNDFSVGLRTHFKEIHPKEEKKSLSSLMPKCSNMSYTEIYSMLTLMAAEIDKLKEGKK